jgi:rod shape-determining protein MreC
MIDLLKRFQLLFIALIFLLPAFLILTLHVREERQTPIVEKVLLQVSFPLQQKVRRAVLWLKEVGEQYIFLTRVQQENQELRRIASALREENNRLQEALWAEERLKKLYALQAKYSSTSRVAQIFARDPTSWFKTVLVNQGKKAGVSKDMAVVTSEGVVGRVIEVSASTAKVLLITDPNCALDVIVQRSRSQGIMEGKVGESCILKYVQKSEDVQVGDRVITSGLGRIFPKGLVAGTVTQVERKRPGIFQYIEVTPSVDFSRLEEVLILGGERP